MKTSFVIACHNEEKYLPYVMRSWIEAIKLYDETLIILDNCTDRSEELINMFIKSPKVNILQFGEHEWRYYASEVFEYGYSLAKGDIIQTFACDLIFDPQMFWDALLYMESDENVGTVCFRYYNYNPFSLKLQLHGTYENLYRNLIEKIRKEARHTGVYAIRREMREEIGGFADIISEYDEYCLRAKKHGWKVIYDPYTKILHLRAGLTAKKQYSQGTARAYIPHYNFVKTFFHSMIHFKPHLLTGYLHAKRYQFFDAGDLSHAG